MAQIAYSFTATIKDVRSSEVDIDLGNCVVLTLPVDADAISVTKGASVKVRVEIPTQEKPSG